jgi:hypothetical protein
VSQVRAIAATLALLLLAYVAAYLALAAPARCGISMGGASEIWVKSHYRAGGQRAEAVFRPSEVLDRRVRPTFWATRYKPSVMAVYVPADDPTPD